MAAFILWSAAFKAVRNGFITNVPLNAMALIHYGGH